MVHVGKHHVNGEWVFIRASDDKHVQDVDYTGVFQALQNLDFAQRGDRHALLFVVHQNSLQGDQTFGCILYGFVHLTEGTFAKLSGDGVIGFGATAQERLAVCFDVLLRRPL